MLQAEEAGLIIILSGGMWVPLLLKLRRQSILYRVVFSVRVREFLLRGRVFQQPVLAEPNGTVPQSICDQDSFLLLYRHCIRKAPPSAIRKSQSKSCHLDIEIPVHLPYDGSGSRKQACRIQTAMVTACSSAWQRSPYAGGRWQGEHTRGQKRSGLLHTDALTGSQNDQTWGRKRGFDSMDRWKTIHERERGL